jgi:hypothetical protein
VPPHCGPLGPRQAGGALRARPGGCVVEGAVLFHDVFAELRDAASALAAMGWRGEFDKVERTSSVFGCLMVPGTTSAH